MFLLLGMVLYIFSGINLFIENGQSTFEFLVIGTLFIIVHFLMCIKLSLDNNKKETAKTLSDVIVAAKLLDIASKNGVTKDVGENKEDIS